MRLEVCDGGDNCSCSCSCCCYCCCDCNCDGDDDDDLLLPHLPIKRQNHNNNKFTMAILEKLIVLITVRCSRFNRHNHWNASPHSQRDSTHATYMQQNTNLATTTYLKAVFDQFY